MAEVSYRWSETGYAVIHFRKVQLSIVQRLREALDLGVGVHLAAQDDHDVDVGLGMSLAARVRAVEDHARKAVAVERVEAAAQVAQERLDVGPCGFHVELRMAILPVKVKPKFAAESMRNALSKTSTACLTVLLALAMGACDAGYQTPPLAEFDAIVHGRVEAPSGRPASGAGVLVLAHFDACDSTAVSQGVAYTDERGFYLRRIKDFTASEVTCVTAVADVPPIGEDARDGDSTVSTNIRLREAPPYDSVRVDVVLDE